MRLGVVAHDLRAPLASIQLSARVVADSDDDDDDGRRQREVLKRVERGAAHMTRLVQDLLDVSRLAVTCADVVPAARGA